MGTYNYILLGTYNYILYSIKVISMRQDHVKSCKECIGFWSAQYTSMIKLITIHSGTLYDERQSIAIVPGKS